MSDAAVATHPAAPAVRAGAPLPADAPAGLHALLTGPERPGRVLAAFPHAVYVAVEGDDAVVALVTGDGIRLPNALVVRAPAATGVLRGVAAGTPGVVGRGRVRIGTVLDVAAARWSDRRVRLVATDAATLHRGAAALAAALPALPADDAVRHGTDRLAAALLDADRPAAAAAAAALLGLGPGLTPSGDDVLAGLVAAGRAFAPAVGSTAAKHLLLHLAGHVLAAAPARTTALSVALLRHAAAAEMAAPAAALTRAVAAGRDPAAALEGLLRVGHRSGHDLAAGIAAAAEVVARLLPSRPATPGGRP
jgi:hypothetical protein